MTEDRRYPRRVETCIRGFHVFTTVYLALAAKALITGRPARVVLVMLAFACVPETFCAIYRRRVLRRGFAVWRFKVLANTYFIYKGDEINCIMVAPLVAPYADKMFEIILRDDEELPKVGSVIEVCIPSDIKVFEAENRYIISGHYEIKMLEAV